MKCKICITCGHALSGKQSKFCSRNCEYTKRSQVRTEKLKAKKLKVGRVKNGLKCVVCDGELTGQQRKCCSEECRKKNVDKINREFKVRLRAGIKLRADKPKHLCMGCKNFMGCRNFSDWLEIPECVEECEIINYEGHDNKFTKSLIVSKCKDHKGGM